MALSASPPRQITPKPLHNHAGTVMALARQILHDLDPQSEHTSIRTATLQVLCEMLCEMLGNSPEAVRRQAAGQAAVMGLMKEVSDKMARADQADGPNLRLPRFGAAEGE